MSDWQVGDLAVCVEARRSPLTEGSVYTVAAVFFDPAYNTLGEFTEHTLLLREITPWPGKNGFCPTRFRKIRPDERQACEPEFVTLLKRSKRKVAA
jgi:hypothetical protein